MNRVNIPSDNSLQKQKKKKQNTAPCISHKWKDTIIEEHDAQSQQPKQNIKMFNVGDFLQEQKSASIVR